MTTYTIKPIEWREGLASINGKKIGKVYSTFGGHCVRAVLLIGYFKITDVFSNSAEAKSFVETSYREFVEQFLEKQ